MGKKCCLNRIWFVYIKIGIYELNSDEDGRDVNKERQNRFAFKCRTDEVIIGKILV